MVTSDSIDSTEPVALAGRKGFTTVSTSYSNLPDKFSAAYALSASNNKINNIYFEATENNGHPSFLSLHFL